jgi:putative membrane protein
VPDIGVLENGLSQLGTAVPVTGDFERRAMTCGRAAAKERSALFLLEWGHSPISSKEHPMQTLRIASIIFLTLFGANLVVESGEKDKAVSDADFVLKASESDLTEVDLGKLASKQGASTAVREFGAKMAKDHTKSSEELKAIAKKQGFMLTSELGSKHKQMCEKLSKITGTDFDHQYIAGQVKAHKQAVELFKNQAKNGQNADVRAFASKTLPVIEEHLMAAQEIARAVEEKK